MATKKPRITVTLDDKDYEQLKYFSDAVGQSMSSIIAESMHELLPALKRMAGVVHMAKALDANAREQMRRSLSAKITPAERLLDDARDDALQAVAQAMDGLEELLQRAYEGQADGGASDPRASGDAARRQGQPPSL